MLKLLYDTEKYPFKEIVTDMVGGELSRLHFLRQYDKFERKNDQKTIFHKRYYRKFKELESLYELFIEEIIQPMHLENIVYQSIPTFRVHMPNNIAVGEWHKDKHYRNQGWAERVGEFNYFLPLTDAFGTNTVWAESKEDRGDFSPIELEYGEMARWDASNLMHGNKENKTGTTRVSVDFRVILDSKYEDSDQTTINTNTAFKVGEYYKRTKMVYNTIS